MRAIWPGALLSVYLAATGVLLVAGGRAESGALAIHLTLLAAVTATWVRAAPAWLRAWTPLVLLFFLYSELPSLIEAAGHRQTLDPLVIAWEQALFDGQPATTWARALPSTLVSEPLHLAYLSYYGIIYAVPALLWLSGRREEFHDAAFALLLTFVACFVCYIVFPVAGPRYLWPSSAPDGAFRGLALWLLESGSSRGTAFPSSHVAVAVAQSVLGIRFLGRRGVPVVVLTVGLGLGAVYGGFHYAIDVIAGALLGGTTALMGLRLTRRLRAQAKASAPM